MKDFVWQVLELEWGWDRVGVVNGEIWPWENILLDCMLVSTALAQ